MIKTEHIRKLDEVNKSMVTKVAWRIISSPDSLLAQVLRAKNAKKGVGGLAGATMVILEIISRMFGQV